MELAALKREERISNIQPPKPSAKVMAAGILALIMVSFAVFISIIAENKDLLGITLFIDISILLFLIFYYCDKMDKYNNLKNDPVKLREYKEQTYQKRIEENRNKIPKKKSTAILLCCFGFLGICHPTYETS